MTRNHVSKRDVMLGFTIGFLVALIAGAAINVKIFSKIIRENRQQEKLILELIDKKQKAIPNNL